MKPFIEVQNLSFKYSKNGPMILDSVNMTIEKGSITAIAGLSGCGKSTLAAIASVMSLDPDIIILDEVLSELDRENKELIIYIIKMLNKAGKTIIIIDHSIKNLMVANTILLMKNGKIEDRIEVNEDHELLYSRLSDFFLCQK